MTAETGALPALHIDPIGVTPGRRILKRVLGQNGLMIGAVILALIVLAARFAPLLAPHDH